ncbi:MAG: hypothetical protein GVY26_10795 [Bacteroidetes bacterium]|jgi:hypothetical protein|nr:hypothetical protein [Bacteroidota bacterium]
MKEKYWIINLTLALLSSVVWSGCDLINPEEPVPGYVHIPAVEVVTKAGEGTAASKLTEVWVTVGGEFVGAYPIPADIPILAEGEVDLFVQAGIKDNGIGSLPEIYPFFEAYEATVSLGPNTTDTIRPVFRYLEQTRFALVEGFENGSQVFRDVLSGSSGQLRLVEDEVFEGNSALQIRLDSASNLLRVATLERYPEIVGNNSARVYLEMHYKSEVPVVFGLIGYASGQLAGGRTEFIAGFRPSEEWNKIYFNFSLDAIELGSDEYQVFLQASIPDGEDGVPSLSEARIWLDNVKLLHF